MAFSRYSVQLRIDEWNVLIRRWITKLTVSSFLLIVIGTLFPFEFSIDSDISIQAIFESFSRRGKLQDLAVNILLYMPLGFGLTGLFEQKHSKQATQLTLVLGSTLATTLTIEILQAFLPSRYSSLADIYGNLLGSFLGFLCFLRWKHRLFQWCLELRQSSYTWFSAKRLAIVLATYTAILIVIASSIPTAVSLRNWSLFFPMVLGNEYVGDRPWQGHLAAITIAHRSLSASEVSQSMTTRQLTVGSEFLVADYTFMAAQQAFHDRSGHTPDLIWVGQTNPQPDAMGISLSNNHWLATEDYVSGLLQNLRQSSQFSLSLIFATANLQQTGPAQIVSFSNNSKYRNFTVSQQDSNLAIWLRTPLSGNNGKEPELIIPNAITDTDWHHLIITYDGSRLNCYIDQAQHPYTFTLNSGFIIPFVTSLTPARSILYQVLLYSLLYGPVGYILALLLQRLQKPTILKLILASMLVLPVLLQETIVAHLTQGEIQRENLWLGSTLMAIALLIASATHQNKP